MFLPPNTLVRPRQSCLPTKPFMSTKLGRNVRRGFLRRSQTPHRSTNPENKFGNLNPLRGSEDLPLLFDESKAKAGEAQSIPWYSFFVFHKGGIRTTKICRTAEDDARSMTSLSFPTSSPDRPMSEPASY